MFISIHIILFSLLCEGYNNLVPHIETPTMSATSTKTELSRRVLNTTEARINSRILTCQSSSECIDGTDTTAACVGLSSNGSLTQCSDSVSPCVCRKFDNIGISLCVPFFTSGCPFYNRCAMEGVISGTCMPCDLFEFTSFASSIFDSSCRRNARVLPPTPPDRAHTIMEACMNDAHCEGDLICQAPSSLGGPVQCSHGNMFISCMCYPTHFLGCNILKPCPSTEMCVSISDIFNNPRCMSTESVGKSLYPMDSVYVLPRFLFTTLFVIELSFIAIKLTFQGKLRLKLRLIAGGAFVLESLAGITSTVIQSIAMFKIGGGSIFGDNESSLIIFMLGVLFVISELISVIAEARNTKERIFQKGKDTVQEEEKDGREKKTLEEVPKPRFSLSRRIIVKWLCVISCGMNLSFGLYHAMGSKWDFTEDSLVDEGLTQATVKQYNMGLTVIQLATVVYLFIHTIVSLLWRRKLIVRIVSTLCFAAIFGVVTLWTLFHPSHFPHICVESYATYGLFAVDLAIMAFALHILLTATSAFNLQGFKLTGSVTQEQAEFIETAILGTVPLILMISTSPICSRELTTLLIVGFPQIIVLLGPVLVEYFPGVKRHVLGEGGNKLEQEQQQDEESTDPLQSTTSSEKP